MKQRMQFFAKAPEIMKPLETRKAIAEATSSARPMRPTGVLPAYSAKTACRWSSGRKSHHGVSMTPGATTLTRRGFSSTARIGATVKSMGTYSADDFESGTRAALAGGTTMVVDFCLPAPQQSLLEALQMWDNKTSKAACDYSFHMRGFGLSVAMTLVLAAGQASAASIDLSKPYGDKYGCINRNGQEVAADQMLLLTDKELITAASACTFTKTQAQADGSLVVTAT